jgi:hypothetical protein
MGHLQNPTQWLCKGNILVRIGNASSIATSVRSWLWTTFRAPTGNKDLPVRLKQIGTPTATKKAGENPGLFRGGGAAVKMLW